MATYKVIQDIEAEDKLIGWLTLQQFIYAGIVVVCGFIGFQLFQVAWWLAFPFVPPMLFFGLLASPMGRDQPTDVWLLAKIRFFLKPRKRVWDQTGMKQLVSVLVPKRVERRLTDGLSQSEVKSRLQALANTIDSRGWSTKNVNVNMFAAPAYSMAAAAVTDGSDRLLGPNNFPRDVPMLDPGPTEDMFDPRTNPRAQQLSQMMDASAQAHHDQALAIAGGAPLPAPNTYPVTTAVAARSASVAAVPPADYWFLNGVGKQVAQPQPGYATFGTNPVVTSDTGQSSLPQVQTPVPQPILPNSSAAISRDEEAAILKHIHEEKAREAKQNHGHIRVVPTPAELQQKQIEDARIEAEKAAMTRPSNPAILELSRNDDLDVATIARQAKKHTEPKQSGADGEVVVSLHEAS